jgi:hypothetical protein
MVSSDVMGFLVLALDDDLTVNSELFMFCRRRSRNAHRNKISYMKERVEDSNAVRYSLEEKRSVVFRWCGRVEDQVTVTSRVFDIKGKNNNAAY